MKSTFLFLAAALFALSFTSCSKDDETPREPGETTESYIDATSSTVWHYYSFAQGDTIGSAAGTEANDALWAARKDWDIAIRRMYVRTNSGKSTTVGAFGGLFAFDVNNKDKAGNINVTTSFASVENVSDTAVFVTDAKVTYAGMGGDVTTSQSTAVVTAMQKKWDDELKEAVTVMPPNYMRSPVYIFRTADGKSYYKLEFTQYKNDNNVSGHVKFNSAQIYKD